MLCRYGFDDDSLETSRAALKCLANVLLLANETRQIFVDLGYASKAAARIKVKSFRNRAFESEGLMLYRMTTGRMNCLLLASYFSRPMMRSWTSTTFLRITNWRRASVR